MSNPTKANAEAIYRATNRAVDYLMRAQGELRCALALAENDYEYNDEKIRDLYGSVRLVASVANLEAGTWRGRSRNRKDEAEALTGE
ncbi:hypothetical protein PBI_EISH_56 [Mycobacterium phage Eish]|uniref:Uncharacterized protein n=2 Tax=Cheoctovirus TaxID=1623281 RepID=A0A649V7T2_9CAUD|nr:hypothetical protein PBI_ESTAVE1_54 [Mycobacterium phage Estave1]YP_009956398.1 hypothetical protein I5H31_gp056 [Mycobacterium phage Eish]AIM40444.1 hypothetical protein PBI_ESTAVE1_54 [Mycobacterium phage Estave1]QGJ88428.1 hypothetical protein PBI_EISH_56 [Mycobacterium phage Eish]